MACLHTSHSFLNSTAGFCMTVEILKKDKRNSTVFIITYFYSLQYTSAIVQYF